MYHNKLISYTKQDDQETTSPSPHGKYQYYDEEIHKANLKAHDSRGFLLKKGRINIEQILNKKKQSRPRTNVIRKRHQSEHLSFDASNLQLPINNIPLQEKYNENSTPLYSQIAKYPKLQNYFMRRNKSEREQVEPQIEPKQRSFKINYGAKFEAFVKKLPSQESRIRVQQLYDKYTYKKINKSLYENNPLSDGQQYTYKNLINIQNKILNKDLNLSYQNQIKLEENLKQIYQQICLH